MAKLEIKFNINICIHIKIWYVSLDYSQEAGETQNNPLSKGLQNACIPSMFFDT